MQAAPNNKPKKKRKEEQTAEELHLFCKSELGSKCTPSDVLFVPQSSRIAVLCREENSGSIRVLKFDVDESNTGKLTLLRTINCNAIGRCGTFDASSLAERFLAVGEFTGGLSVWDLEANRKVYEVAFHSEIINSIDGCGGSSVDRGPAELVTGCRDGSVCVWDQRQKGKPVVVFKHAEEDCWCVCFARSTSITDRNVCAGFDSGMLMVWDLRSSNVLAEHKETEGFCSVSVTNKYSASPHLLATTVEDDCYLYNFSSLTSNKERRATRHVINTQQTTVWDGAFSPHDQSLFVTSGGNGSLHLYKTYSPPHGVGDPLTLPPRASLLHSLAVTPQPITCFDWHPSKQGLCLFGSMDNSVSIAIVC